MINWLALLKGLLSLANYVAKVVHDKQLLDAGEFKAISKANAQALEKVRLAIAARNGSLLDPNDAANQ
jgi:hypothetical protein